MSDFSTSFELEAQVSQRSLRSARSTIEDELNDVTVDVDASASNQMSSGGTRMAGKERAMSRSLLSDQAQQLSTLADHIQENLGLNEERNDILRDILDAQELTAREDGGDRFRLPGLGGAIGMAGGGLLIAALVGQGLASVNWGSVVSDAIPDIGPGDVIEGAGATISAGALVTSKLAVEANHLISGRADITPGDLIDGSGAAITAPALIASKLSVEAGHVIAEPVAIAIEDILETGEGEPEPSPTASGEAARAMAHDPAEAGGLPDPADAFTAADATDAVQAMAHDPAEAGGLPDPAAGDEPVATAEDFGTSQADLSEDGTNAIYRGPDPLGLQGKEEQVAAVGGLVATGGLLATGVGAGPGAGIGATSLAALGVGGALVGGAAAEPNQPDRTPQNETTARETPTNRTQVDVGDTNVTVEGSSKEEIMREVEAEQRRQREELRRELNSGGGRL